MNNVTFTTDQLIKSFVLGAQGRTPRSEYEVVVTPPTEWTAQWRGHVAHGKTEDEARTNLLSNILGNIERGL